MPGIYKGKRVLITGHTGFKGAWLTFLLHHLGAKLCGYSVDIPTEPSFFETLKLNRFIEDSRGDIRDLKALQKVFTEFKPEIVFHMAAQPLVRASYDDPKETFDVNVGGTVNVLECVRLHDFCRAAVIITTDKCYENLEQETPYKETDRLGGHDPYSASKAAAEIATISYIKSFFKSSGASRASSHAHVASVRAGNVIGGGDWAGDRLVPDCMRAWASGKPVVIRNPDSLRPWQHVLDPLNGYLRVGEELLRANPQVSGEAFNFGPETLNLPLVGALVENLKKSWPGAQLEISRGAGDHKHEAKLLSLDITKAKKVLNWKPLISSEDMLAMTSSWYKSFYDKDAELEGLTLKQLQKLSLNDF